MESDTQRLERFHADFQKLKNNREKVPLQQLTTRYARSYNTLVAEVMDQFQAALIDQLDMDAYHDLVNGTYEPRLRVFNRYWSRHCRCLESGWIYNRILKKFWWPKTEGYPESGCWINSDYSGRDYRYPPQLKEE